MMRVRFAPSPTGPFHIGGARSALFNWLLARKTGGKLILRIENTDLERSTKESEENIKEALRWLGMDWDEGVDVGGPHGPYHQTDRLHIYETYTQRLLEEGRAYHCYCSEEELDAERQALSNKGELPRYLGKCRQLTAEGRAQLAAEGRKPTVRFRVPEGQQITFKDLVRGTVSFESNGVGDFVIVKSDGIPVYNYAVVIDDALMEITHVIRAEEHLSNTPRQILLFEALGFALPQFGHISLILGKDRTKMSKRHGATSVEQYRNLGYLPEALVNFLALLGWAPGSEQEFFQMEELIQEFSMDRVAKNPAVFDIDKLNWLNAHYLRKAEPAKIAALALPHVQAAGFLPLAPSQQELEQLTKITAVLQDHISYAAQLAEHVDIFYNDNIVFESAEAGQMVREPEFIQVADAFCQRLEALEAVTVEAVKGLLKSLAKELALPGKKVYMPLRIAMTGKMHGPDLFNIIPVIGRERIIARVQGAKTASA